jgi:hypothetical protein
MKIFNWIYERFFSIFNNSKPHASGFFMDKESLNLVAQSLGIYPAWLNSLITFESAWKPDARNPYSGARGLIQFTNTTARALGYASADDLYNQNPTDTAQLLGPVLKYLSPMKPFPTEQSLYMAVFYPAARNWDPATEFSPAIQAVNPGIKTVADYVNKVRHAPIIKTAVDMAGIVLIAASALLAYQYIAKPLIEKEVVKWQTTKQTSPQAPLQIVSPETI